MEKKMSKTKVTMNDHHSINSFKNTKTKFPLGTAWEEYTADGRTTQTITTIEGNSIIKVILKTPSP